MGRKLTHPGSNRTDRQPQPARHRQFYDVFEDESAADIPQGTIKKALNAIALGDKVAPRNGSTLHGRTMPPAVEGRTGYAAHTDGDYIVSDSGDIFTPADISFLWAWDDGTFDEIVGYVNPTTVRRRDTDENIGSNCYIQGRPNLWKWHTKQRVFVVHLGHEIYVCDYNMEHWTQAVQDCHWTIGNTESQMAEDGDHAIIANSRYCWRLVITTTPPVMYPINSPVMERCIVSNDGEGEREHRYNYLVSMARLAEGENFRNRLDDPPTLIHTESGTTRIDEARRDWVTVWEDDPIGPGSDTYETLEGGSIAGIALAALAVIGDACIQINFNGGGYAGIVMDFQAATSMYDIAAILQAQCRVYAPSATCEYVFTRGEPRLRLSCGRVSGGTVDYVLDGVGGTNVADLLELRAADGALIEEHSLDAPAVQRQLTIPPEQWVSGQLQHWPTHYVVYRTADLGPTGYNISVLGERIANSPDQYVWAKDLRVCGSFIARRYGGSILLRSGEFEPADVGAVVEFEDGSRTEILGYVSSTEVTYAAAYYDDSTEWMAANIGNARVARVTQTGTTVTVVAGSDTTSFGPLAAGDVRLPGWWPDGRRSYIRRRISDTEWEVWDSSERSETAFAIAPTSRAWSDTISDDVLRSHASGWACRNRFMREVMPSNHVAAQAAFMVFAERGAKEFRYCPLNPNYKPYLGYHNREYQTMELQDRVMALWPFSGMFSVFCQGSIHTVPTGSSIEITIPETYQKIWQLPMMEKRANFGISDHGSLAAVGQDMVRFATSTGECLDFDGYEHGPDLCVSETGLKRWVRALAGAHPIFAAIHSKLTGYILWWVKR